MQRANGIRLKRRSGSFSMACVASVPTMTTRPRNAWKRLQFDDETWQSLDLLAKEQMKTFAELADEAFGDLLKKDGRPVDLRDALRKSAGKSATVHQLHPTMKNRKRAS
jgi:hypothetical protein